MKVLIFVLINFFCFVVSQLVVTNCISANSQYVGTAITACVACCCAPSISLSSLVKTIGLQAFYACTVLTNVVIPSTVTTVGQQAFQGCTLLTQLNLPTSVVSIFTSAFQGKKWKYTIYFEHIYYHLSQPRS